MPELPEVETVRRTLLPLCGDRIVEVVVREPRLRQPVAPQLPSQLTDRLVREIRRRGKYLLFSLSDDQTLLAHLGMTGSLVIVDPDYQPEKHDHVILAMASQRRLVFNDPRRFGLLKVGMEQSFSELAHLGPDPLTSLPDAESLRALFRGRKRSIKDTLMDQQRLVGIGNIYANEILFRAGIRPRRPATRISRLEIERLRAAILEVLEEAVSLGGSSISDYRDGSGKPGYFQMQHRVYDRDGSPCRSCGTEIRRVVLGGRSTFYCVRCQR